MRISDKRRKAIMAEIHKRLVDGNESLRAICRDEHMPNKSTILEWMNGSDELADHYARARLLQADGLDDDVADVVQEVREGKLDPKAAKVIIWAHQWRAARMNPKRYGDKIDHKHSGALTIGIRQNERVDADDE